VSGIPPVLAELLRPVFPSELSRARVHRGRLAALLTRFAGASAIVFGRHVFVSRAGAACLEESGPGACRLLAHELAHVSQYRRLWAAPFLGRYLGEYLRGRLDGLSHRAAYLSISFEREAEERAQALREEIERG
jgi:hypothetical protein